MSRIRLVCLIQAGILTFATIRVCTAQEAESLKTGKSFQTALTARISITGQSPLGDRLSVLQQQAEIAILRDRRLDPHQTIFLETDSVPRVQVLKQISSAIPDCTCCVTESFVYLGPSKASLRLPVLLERASHEIESLKRRVPASAYRQLTASRARSWELLAEPRQLLVSMAKDAGVRIENPERVPHDVWGAGVLPKMTFAEAAAVILNQFDLMLTPGDGPLDLAIAELDLQEEFDRRYSVGKLKSAVAKEWESRLPEVHAEWSSSVATIRATLDQHALLNGIVEDLKLASETRTADSAQAGSLRKEMFQLTGQRQTVEQIILAFRKNRVIIEVKEEDSSEVQRIYRETIDLSELREKLPGSKFFPRIFGSHFSRVEVLPDRVILER